MFQALLVPLLVGMLGGAIAFGLGTRGQRFSTKLRLELPATPIIVAIALVYSAVFSWFGVRHYEAMNAHVTDVALMDQLVWATLHGQFMHTTLQGLGVDNFMAFHFEPFMALISPLYLLAPSAATLVALQTFGLGLSAIPVGLWAQKRLGSGIVAVPIALAFLLSPVFANDNDLLFEQIPLAVPFLAFAFYFQLQRRWKAFGICLLLALMVREEIAFVAMAMGLYALIVQRQRIGWVVIGVAAAWAAVTLGIVIPAFSGGDVYWASSAYGYLGNTPLAIAAGTLTHPLLVVQHLVSPPRPYFIASLLVPLGLLPLAGWRVSWLALPTLGYLLLGEGKFDPNSWYPSPMLPFLGFGAIEGIAVLRRWIPAHVSAAYLTAAAAAAFHLFGAGPGTVLYSPEAYATTAHSLAARALTAGIPRQLGVSATPQLIAHVSQRMQASIFPELLIPRDVFAIDFKGWRGWHGYPAMFNDYDQALRRLLRDPAYGDFYKGDGLLLLERGQFPAPASHPMSVNLGGKIELLGYDAPDTIQPRQPFTVNLHWRAATQLDQAYTVSLQFGTEANGKLAQQDSWPWDGYYPTLEWTAGLEIVDPHTLSLPRSLAPGQYRLFVSMYSIENGQAKALTTGQGEPGIIVGPFTVESTAR